MAIGVRITSENLAGQTAKIIFHPLTGGTIDLGLQTIPFNYYSELPYGEYSISSTTYDYVYTLKVNQPYGENQNFVSLGNVSGDTNYSVAFLNFNDFSAEIINLGVDSNYWETWDWYPMSESGYMYIFTNNPDLAKLVIFTDVNGNIVEQYSAITENYSYDVLDGRICYFADDDQGIMYFFNGTNVYQYTYNVGLDLEVQWDWDSTCLDKTFIFTLYNPNTEEKIAYRVSNDGSVHFITSWDASKDTRWFGTYYSSNLFYEFSRENVTGYFQYINVYNTSGELVNEFTVQEGVYNNWDLSWYGYSSYSIVLYNDNNNEIDYLIYNYDGLNNTLQTTSHNRLNYNNYNTLYDNLFWPNNYDVGSIFYYFYDTTENYYQGGGYGVNNFDIVYKLKNDSDFTQYTFASQAEFTKQFYLWGSANIDLHTFCNTGDGISSIFSITSNGISIEPTSNVIGQIDNTDYARFGNYFVLLNRYNGNTSTDGYLVKNGIIVSSINVSTSFRFSYDYNYGVFYLASDNDVHYINDQVTEFTSIDLFENIRISDSYYTNQYYFRPGNLVLISDKLECLVITKEKIYNKFTLPSIDINGWDLRVGRDSMIFVYENINNESRMNLYNFNGALLNTSNIIGWKSLFAVKDRYLIYHNGPNKERTLIMISDNDVKQTKISTDFISWYQINDYIWWD